MSSASEQAEMEALLLQLIADTQTTNYLVVASLTLAVIEHVATFRDEVRLIWRGKLRISNAIYIWMRYCSLATLIVYSTFMLREVKSDYSFLLAEAVTSSLLVVTADIILVLRVWVLYGKPRGLLYFLLPLVTAEIITMITVAVFTILPLKEYFHIGPAILGCYSLHVPRYFTFYAVPITVTSFTMFIMTLYKCGRTMDGVFWFLAIFAISIAELIVWARGRPGLAQAMVAPATVCNAVIGTRILLNLKRITTMNSMSTTVPTLGLENDNVTAGSMHFSSLPWHLRTADTRDL